MELPCHPLSFFPNFKPSRALNHLQSDLQEVPIREVSRGIIFVGPQLRDGLFFAFPYLFGELANNKF